MSAVIYPCDDGCQCGQEPCRSNNPAYYTSRFLRDGETVSDPRELAAVVWDFIGAATLAYEHSRVPMEKWYETRRNTEAALDALVAECERLTGRNQFLSTEQVRADVAEAALEEMRRERDEAVEAHRLINLGWNDAMARARRYEEALREIAEEKFPVARKPIKIARAALAEDET